MKFKNLSSKAHSHCNSKSYTDCRYFNIQIDKIYHCCKDSNIEICSYESIDISKLDKLEDFIDKYLDSVIKSKIIKD